ncbi:DUF4260 domain-containing protein [Ancylobacter sp. FA202]|uniref:DUF4260 domain-containing protein n=1 Tax=Ancylobacter sp. FA202 TaxID=1111106 RepID=UPI00037FCC8A|nr:DUF4260 domain-containing protein [Ancylobacter sp. FA202]
MTTRLGGPTGAVTGAPAALLRAEGLAVFAAALVAYAALGASWWLFAALILAPDLSMLAYLAGPRPGALFYNAAHTYVAPALLGGLAYGFSAPLAGAIALIWIAHIGLDRVLGYGLKYAAGFADTHLGRIGRN